MGGFGTAFAVAMLAIAGADIASRGEIGTADAGDVTRVSSMPGTRPIDDFKAFDTVYFDPGSADLRPDALKTVLYQAWMMRHFPDTIASIEGYADGKGSRGHDLDLGARRATAVRQHLISLGIDGGRLTAAAMGDCVPEKGLSGDLAPEKCRSVVTVWKSAGSARR